MHTTSDELRHETPLIGLQLDARLKRTLQDLFLTAAQVPSLGLENGTLSQDAAAVFRVAKEFSAVFCAQEQRRVAALDVVRTLRFVCWLLSYEADAAAVDRKVEERARKAQLQQFFASVVLQAQSQFSGFESLLCEYGIDRQLEHQLREPARAGKKREAAKMNAGQSTRTKQIHIRLSPGGAELTSTTTESTWTIDGWKESTR